MPDIGAEAARNGLVDGAGEATFLRPEGPALPAVPPPFAGWDGAAALAWLDEWLDEADITIDPHTATPA